MANQKYLNVFAEGLTKYSLYIFAGVIAIVGVGYSRRLLAKNVGTLIPQAILLACWAYCHSHDWHVDSNLGGYRQDYIGCVVGVDSRTDHHTALIVYFCGILCHLDAESGRQEP